MVSELQFDSGSYYANSVTKESSWADPAEAGWRKVADPAGNTYWFNPKVRTGARGRCREGPPPNAAVQAGLPHCKCCDQQLGCSATNACVVAASELLQACAKRCHAVQTKESTWERPESLSWRTVASPEHEGRLYYVNDVSQEASWEKPAAMAWEKHVFSQASASAASEL
jgi:hypothetical protein